MKHVPQETERAAKEVSEYFHTTFRSSKESNLFKYEDSLISITYIKARKENVFSLTVEIPFALIERDPIYSSKTNRVLSMNEDEVLRYRTGKWESYLSFLRLEVIKHKQASQRRQKEEQERREEERFSPVPPQADIPFEIALGTKK